MLNIVLGLSHDEAAELIVSLTRRNEQQLATIRELEKHRDDFMKRLDLTSRDLMDADIEASDIERKYAKRTAEAAKLRQEVAENREGWEREQSLVKDLLRDNAVREARARLT